MWGVAFPLTFLELRGSPKQLSWLDESECDNSPSTKLPGAQRDVEERHPDIPYVPATYIMVHRLSGVMHVSASELTFACGRRISSAFVSWNSNSFETVDTNICAQCKAKAAMHFREDSSELTAQAKTCPINWKNGLQLRPSSLSLTCETCDTRKMNRFISHL